MFRDGGCAVSNSSAPCALLLLISTGRNDLWSLDIDEQWRILERARQRSDLLLWWCTLLKVSQSAGNNDVFFFSMMSWVERHWFAPFFLLGLVGVGHLDSGTGARVWGRSCA